MTVPRSGVAHPKRYGSRPRRLKRRSVGEVPKALNRRILALQPRQVLAGDRIVTVRVAAQRAVLAELCHWRVWSQAQGTQAPLTPTCRTSVTKIAERTGLDRRTVSKALQALYGAQIIDMPSPPGEWTLLIDHQREAEDSCALSAQTVQPGAIESPSTQCSDGAPNLSTQCADGATNSSTTSEVSSGVEPRQAAPPTGGSAEPSSDASASTAAAASPPRRGDGPRHPRPSGSEARAAGGGAPEPPVAAAAVAVGFSPCEDDGYIENFHDDLLTVFHQRCVVAEQHHQNMFQIQEDGSACRRLVPVEAWINREDRRKLGEALLAIGDRETGVRVVVPSGALVAALHRWDLRPSRWRDLMLALWEKARDGDLRSPVGLIGALAGDVACGERPRRVKLLGYVPEKNWDAWQRRQASQASQPSPP